MTADQWALWGCGIYFLTGLLTGVWKYWQIATNEKGRAHYYVDVAHRASLMYAFACLAIGSYILHGFLQDTRNQLQRPHRLGGGSVPELAMSTFMVSLIVAEVGGFAVLFAGFVMR